MLRQYPNATPNDFANWVASSVAHEFGHMEGLRHPTSGPANNLMNWGRTRGQDYIVNGAVNTENGYQQNAYLELSRSLAGQSTIYGEVRDGYADRLGTSHSEHQDHEQHRQAYVSHPLSSWLSARDVAQIFSDSLFSIANSSRKDALRPEMSQPC